MPHAGWAPSFFTCDTSSSCRVRLRLEEASRAGAGLPSAVLGDCSTVAGNVIQWHHGRLRILCHIVGAAWKLKINKESLLAEIAGSAGSIAAGGAAAFQAPAVGSRATSMAVRPEASVSAGAQSSGVQVSAPVTG